jgi:hypothetical protein
MADVKLVRLRNTTTGAVVQVREGKDLGSEWAPVEAPKAPAPKAAVKKSAVK